MNFIDYCSKIFNLCLNYSKTENLINTNSLYLKENLLFLKKLNIENSQSEIVPNFHLSDGAQLFFNYFSKVLNINILEFVNYFLNAIFFVIIVNLIYSIFKSNLNNKIILLILTITFYVSNITIYNMSSEYLIYSFACLIPLIFLINLNNERHSINLISLLLYSFFTIIILGTIRYYSYLGLSVIFIIILVYSKLNLIKKIISTFVIFFLIILNFFILSNTEKIRENNIKQANPDFKYEKSVPGNNIYTTFYPGLGFLNNTYGINGFQDNNSFKKNLLPKNYKKKYENIGITNEHHENIKDEVWRIVTNYPNFVIKNIFAKLGILIFYFLVICNFFIFNFLFNNKISKIVKNCLLINILFSSIFPIIAIPSLNYSSGFITASFCILVISIGHYKKLIK